MRVPHGSSLDILLSKKQPLCFSPTRWIMRAHSFWVYISFIKGIKKFETKILQAQLLISHGGGGGGPSLGKELIPASINCGKKSEITNIGILVGGIYKRVSRTLSTWQTKQQVKPQLPLILQCLYFHQKKRGEEGGRTQKHVKL